MRTWILALILAVFAIILAVGGILYLLNIGPFTRYEYPKVYIRPNGDVEPASTPINHDGNLYTLQAEVALEKLFIEKSNIILDGNGFSFKIVGPASKGGLIYGGFVEVLNVENVILRNLNSVGRTTFVFENSSSCEVSSCFSPFDLTGRTGVFFEKSLLSGEVVNGSISIIINSSHNILVSDMPLIATLENSRNCTISSCILTSVTLEDSDENMFLNNDMTLTKFLAFKLVNSRNNLFFGNHVERTHKLFEIIGSSSNNLFVGNYIRGAFSIDPLLYSGVNTFYHNNFVYVYWNKTTVSTPNLWDNGSEGNYWNDYQGEDANGDGLGDSPHLIDVNNEDRHPLMNQVDLSLEPQPKLPK